MRYAAETSVPIESSKAEIERTLRKYGAARFMSGWDEAADGSSARAMIGFEMHNRQVRFVLPMPSQRDPVFTHYQHSNRSTLCARKPAAAMAAWEQACRQRWRALNLVIKAKLEAVECGIILFEEEFLAHIVLPNNKTDGEFLIPQIEAAYESKSTPKMLPFLEGKKL